MDPIISAALLILLIPLVSYAMLRLIGPETAMICGPIKRSAALAL